MGRSVSTLENMVGFDPYAYALRRQQLFNAPVAQAQNPYERMGAALGNIVGGSIFGLEDQNLKRAADINRIYSDVMAGTDPTQPDFADRLGILTRQLSNAGYGDAAMYASNQARAIKKEAAAEARAEEELGIRKEDLELRRKQAAEAKETNLVTTNGDPIVKKEGKFFVQTTDDEGNVQLNPYSKKAYGPIETKSDYARAQAAAGGSAQRQAVYGPGGIPIGYDVLDSKGNFVRRELFRGGAGTAAGPEQPTPGAAPKKDKKERPPIGGVLFPPR